MKTLFENAKIIFPDHIAEGCVSVEDGTIITAGEKPAVKFDAVIDCEGNYLAPGFVELHTHGAGGADFMDERAEDTVTACMMHLSHGTTSLLPTALSSTKEEIIRCIDNCRKAKEMLAGKGPNILGLHLEGPYLSPKQSGAMPLSVLRDPKPEEYEDILAYGKGIIKRWTFAIELDGANRFAKRLCEEGILPSVGHSDAEYSEVCSAFENGVTHVTHLFSCMSTIRRVGGFRHSGLLESAFCIPDMTVELISDGCHVPPELLEMTVRLKGPEKTMLTCDSMRCAGLDLKEAYIGSAENGQRAIIEDGVAKLPDRSAFAGSVALDDRLVRVMYHQANVPLAAAVRMMTLTPAEIIKVDGKKGSVAPGKDADLVIFDDDINIKSVFVGGECLCQG